MIWQPIETAPNDGTCIIACRAWPSNNGTYSVAWVGDGYMDDGVWYFASFRIDPDDYYPPTHWMPLPAPPSD